MSKRAEQAALKAYPKEDGKVWTSPFGMIEFDRNATGRKGFQEGYEQAEKDLALTWEDLQTINDLFLKVDAENSAARDDDLIEQDLPFPYGQHFYEEVLRRFREMKNK